MSVSDALKPERLAAELAELVALRSVNGEDSERAVAERIAAWLEPLGCELHFVETLPGRPSLAAVLPGREPDGPRLVLNGHMDTVAPGDPELWSVDPFGGEIRDGCVWGRGALDMKGGLVAQVACARALAARAEPLTGTLVLHFAVGEERGEPGTRSLLDAGFTGDWGITTEPTELDVAIAQRGTAWFTVTVAGHAAHAGTRSEGSNPLERLPALLDAIARYDHELSGRTHPLFPSACITPTGVASNLEANVIPASCTVILDRRLLPGDSSAAARGELERILADLNAADAEGPYALAVHQTPFEPAAIPEDSRLAAVVERIAADVRGSPRPYWGTPYGSDVRNLVNDAGMEAVTFGPGDVRRAHRPDERLEIDSLHRCARVLTRTAVELLA